MNDRHPPVPKGSKRNGSNRSQEDFLASGYPSQEELGMELADELLDDELLDESDGEWEGDPAWAAEFELDEFSPDEFSLDEFEQNEFEQGEFGPDKPSPPQEFGRRSPSAPRRRPQPRRAPRGLAEGAARAGLSWGLQAGAGPALKRRASPGDMSAATSGALRDARELLALLAQGALTARREAEAEGLVAAMVPTALSLAPHQSRALWPAIPGLTQGLIGMARFLRRTPGGRKRLARLPGILAGTVAQLARHAEAGRPVDERIAATLLAKQIHAGLQGRGGHQPSAPLDRPARRAGQPDPMDEEWWDHDAGL